MAHQRPRPGELVELGHNQQILSILRILLGSCHLFHLEALLQPLLPSATLHRYFDSPSFNNGVYEAHPGTVNVSKLPRYAELEGS